MQTYNIYGVCVTSALDLPGVPSWSSTTPNDFAEGADADVVIEVGDVPPELETPCSVLGDFQVGAEYVLLRIPGVASYLMSGGRLIRVQPMPRADAGLVCRFLLRAALTALFFQRQIFPMRAAAIAYQESCILFLGRSGAGKSTLARALAARDSGLLADDVLLISEDGQIILPRAESGHATPELMRMPVRSLYLLRWLLPRTAEPEVQPVPAFKAMIQLRKLVYWPSLIPAMNLEGAFLGLASRLLASASAHEFRRPLRSDCLTAQLETLERSFARG